MTHKPGPSPHGGYDVNAYPIRKTYRDEKTGVAYEVGIYPGEACCGEEDLKAGLAETKALNARDERPRDLAAAY